MQRFQIHSVFNNFGMEWFSDSQELMTLWFYCLWKMLLDKIV